MSATTPHPWWKLFGARALGGFLLIVALSILVWNYAYKNFVTMWPPQIGGDTRSYSYYAAHAFTSPYRDYISDSYFFRTWGYPWILWKTFEEEAVRRRPVGGYVAAEQLEWTADPSLYTGLVWWQTAAFLLIPPACYLLALLLTHRIIPSLLTGFVLLTFPDPLLWARWVIPDGPSAGLNTLCTLLIVGALFAPRWYYALFLAIPAGLLAGFDAMLRTNLLIVPWVFVIASTMVAAGLVWARVKTRNVWLTLITVVAGVLLPFLGIVQYSKLQKKEYAQQTMLTDGFARMGSVVASEFYKDLDPLKLDADTNRVRIYLMALPRPGNPSDGWPAYFNYTNQHAYHLGLTPSRFREIVADLNTRVIKTRPMTWFLRYFWPTLQSECVTNGLMDDLPREPRFKDSVMGKLFALNMVLRQIGGRACDVFLLLGVVTLILAYRLRHDWRVILSLFFLCGVHLGSLSVSSLLAIPAAGRYRFVTEPLELVILVCAFHFFCIWAWRFIQQLNTELRAPRVGA